METFFSIPLVNLAAIGGMMTLGWIFSLLRRNVTIDDVGNTGAFLCSDLAAGITGENIYVDSGYNIVSMGVLE